ncbi:MAG TPA: type II toxin-antitoxin system PemK/MazF family toxin [Tepidisphaeraceae bacterium]|jgi:mRNA-degrading endonuclease toxin of MazEF toxin-antitoxin module|nr:type II toxin-antitoxin system PemK/MazF family toxin [Tepidisphaeraceae bacterium]
MNSERPALRRGRIVWATVSDARGHQKQRPLIILTATDEIREDEPLQAMAVSTTFPDPAPKDHVELPWHPAGRAMTKLRKRSAAVLSWIVEVDSADIVELHGDVPGKVMLEILERLAGLG